MADPRYQLQASFQPSRRHTNYGEALLGLHIRGFRNHVNTPLRIESPVTAFCGVNGSGKSTVLQIAASAYQAPAGQRYHISSFILAGTLDSKPFGDDASVEFIYAAPSAGGVTHLERKLTVSRSGSSWSGYDRQPTRPVLYLGSGFYLPPSERDAKSKAHLGDTNLLVRYRSQLDRGVVDRISDILLCKYDTAHRNSLRKRYARHFTELISTKRQGGVQYSEANMGSGEARLYHLVTQVERIPEKSLVLIEEPETALHPCAQYKLGEYLVEVAMRRGLQVLMTTHSEYLMLTLPQSSRLYFKREAAGVVPIAGIGVRQAISMMDGLVIPAVHVLVEDDVAEAIVTELLRKHDPDFQKTVRTVVTGSKTDIRQIMGVFEEQQMPICAVRDGDFGDDPNLKMYKLFGTEAPEKEVFKSEEVRRQLGTQCGVDWDAVDIANRTKHHHDWFDVLETQVACRRAELLMLVARAYLEGVPEPERQALVDQIKASIP